MGFNERLMSCLMAEMASGDRATGRFGSVWGGRAANLVLVALSSNKDMSGWEADEIRRGFSLESLLANAHSRIAPGAAACWRYLDRLPGFQLDKVDNWGDQVISEVTETHHSFVAMQVTRHSVIEEGCD